MPFSHTHVGRQYRKDFAPFEDAQGNKLTDVYVRTRSQVLSGSEVSRQRF